MATHLMIKIDINSGAIEVTDEKGNPAQGGDLKSAPVLGANLGQIKDVKSLTLMRTSASPDCQWVFISGQWYWICG